MDTIAGLFTGSNRLRIAAYTLDTLTVTHPQTGSPKWSRSLSRRPYCAIPMLCRTAGTRASPICWRGGGRRSSNRRERRSAARVLRQAFEEVASEHRGDRLQTTLQMLWADEVLENQAAMQADLLASADLFVRRKRRAFI